MVLPCHNGAISGSLGRSAEAANAETGEVIDACATQEAIYRPAVCPITESAWIAQPDSSQQGLWMLNKLFPFARVQIDVEPQKAADSGVSGRALCLACG